MVVQENKWVEEQDLLEDKWAGAGMVVLQVKECKMEHVFQQVAEVPVVDIKKAEEQDQNLSENNEVVEEVHIQVVDMLI